MKLFVWTHCWRNHSTGKTMKKKSEIIKRQGETQSLADKLLDQANRDENDQQRDMFIRMYNKAMDEVYTLEWVLTK